MKKQRRTVPTEHGLEPQLVGTMCTPRGAPYPIPALLKQPEKFGVQKGDWRQNTGGAGGYRREDLIVEHREGAGLST